MTTCTARRSVEIDQTAPRQLPLESRASARDFGRVSNFFLFQVASLVFLAPNLVLAANFHDLARLATLLGCVAAAWIVMRGSVREEGLLTAPVDYSTLVWIFALSLGLLLLSGETHLLAPNTDWRVRDAVLADVSLHGFPVLYRMGGADYFLRAPLGMYLTPALAGRGFGLMAAHVAMLAQNAALLAATLYFFVKLSDAPRWGFLFVFTAFGWADQLIQLAAMVAGRETWWNPLYFRYMSHVTNLFWAPNHALPGLWFAVLALLLGRREIDLATAGVSFAFLGLWSPLAAVGEAPFLAFLALRQPLRELASWRLVFGVAASLGLLPIALYLTRDAAEVPHKWLFGVEGFALLYLAFLLVELPRAGIFYAAWSKLAPSDRPLMLFSAAVLCMIPLYSLGGADDFSMRASQTSLGILAFGFARIAASTPRDGKALSLAILTVTILTAFEAAFELRFPFLTPSYPISDCNLATSVVRQSRAGSEGEAAPTHYMARIASAPGWLGTMDGPRLQDEHKKCWPDASSQH